MKEENDRLPATQAYSVPGPSGPIACVVHLPERLPAPLLVCCHGLHSAKDSSKYTAAGEQFCEAGCAVVRFDFSGCGDSAPPSSPDLYAVRMADLSAVIDHARRADWCSDKPVALFGSSLGGYLALLWAASAGPDAVHSIACWSTPFDLAGVHITPEPDDSPAMKSGRIPFSGPSSLRDLPSLKRVIVVHGQQDETVDWNDALDLYRHLGEPRRLLLLEGGDHRILDPADREAAFRATFDWFSEQGFIPQ
jgi:alpha-beta hydrolase superfamily lysophospholipase